jgi:hypothetical protein
MAQYVNIVRSLSKEKFVEMLGAVPRQSREQYFMRHSIKAPRSRGLPRAGAKNEYRMAALFEALQQHEDEELSEELLRSWLLTRRPLLCAALDHLGIEHTDGLTESDDVERIAKLKLAQLQPLLEKICEVAPRDEALIYLHFMGATEVQALEALAP